MTLLSAEQLAALRAATESAMRDTCTITRKSSTARTLNTTTGDYNDPTPDTIYTGDCRIRPIAIGRGNAETGGDVVELRQYAVTLKRSTTGANSVAEGDIMTVTASDDTGLVGRPLYVLNVGWSSENLHRRLIVEDRQ